MVQLATQGPPPGRAVASDDDRAARASGGAVGAAKLSRAAEAARKEIADHSKPLIAVPDEAIANALRIAASK